ncbi:hypothetical protein HYB82_003522 [Salmonella enterica subsp. enterica serovar Tennessee]|nr:hypothetical protein [Salmonella enterica subsp. enterica serovar Braenderup]EBS5150201.1 hypothetical protein [Salmonella enterica subsp. enterica serovar Monschaui]ECJ2895633.1 hypothetical protein [Salmonella enterica subsp. houtenae]EDH9565859.1 hypothetical protein [Salmonella enterica subsp. enterica serovar Tennessee]EDS3897018.1 hypothetical protein [Salmonella enterica subsp. enterica]EDV4816044.1 hypothetical protein [Salmonella enterica subsp. enterica serovar Ealing]
MYFVDNNTGVPTMPAMSPAQSNAVLWFTEGDHNKGISVIGQDYLNGFLAEHLNILAEAGIKPDKSKLNQLVLSIKAIITANAFIQTNNLKEIADAGEAAQAAARGHLGLGKLATKDSLGPTDVNALAKDQNLADVPDKAAGRASLDVYSKAESNENYMAKSQNGADIPDKPLFIKNLGLKETLNPTKRVSIGRPGDGAFDGSTPCINIGDSDSGFIGSADGVIDIYCNNAKVGYIDNAGLHMLAGIATNSDVVLQSDARRHIIIQNADGTPRMFIFKDKDGDGVHINNGNDGGGDFIFGKDGSFYAPAVRAGIEKKLSMTSNNSSALTATFNLWGDANRPTVIELDDDQGWHLYSQRNPDGSIVFTVNGDIAANVLRVGGTIYQNNGDIHGSVWGNDWLSNWLNNNKAAKNTASLATNGWFRDASTGWIYQWGIVPYAGATTITVNLPMPFPQQGFVALGGPAAALWYGEDGASGSAAILNNSQLRVTTDTNLPTAWIAIGK